jgi:hypothetical protein
MARPKRGIPFEEAVKRWGNPDALAQAEQQVAATKAVNPMYVDMYFEVADQSLFAQLHDRALFASAFDDGESTRSIINPEFLEPKSARYRRDAGTLLSTVFRRKFHSVEIFQLKAIPLNILSRPRWFMVIEEAEGPQSDAFQHKRQTSATASVDFRPSSDYRHVWLDGIEYNLTAAQARIVRVLHAAQQNGGDGWVQMEDLRERAKFESAKVSHLFRRAPNWRELIRSDRRGYYRLNN